MPAPTQAKQHCLYFLAALQLVFCPGAGATSADAFDVTLNVGRLNGVHLHPTFAVGAAPAELHPLEAGDGLLSVGGTAVADVSLADFLSACGLERRGEISPVVFPLVESDSPQEGKLLSGFIRVQCLPSHEPAVFRPTGLRREQLIRAAEEEAARQRNLVLAEHERLRQQAAAFAADKARQQREHEDEEQRRQAEAAAAARARLNAISRRARGEEFIYTAVFTDVGPMGISLDLTMGMTAVAEASGAAAALGLRTGDRLVSVNGVDTAKMKPAAAARLLAKSEWPRELTLRVPAALAAADGAVDGASGTQLVLTVVEPEIIRGQYAMRAPTDWGGGANLTTDQQMTAEAALPGSSSGGTSVVTGEDSGGGRGSNGGGRGSGGDACYPWRVVLTDPALACDDKLLAVAAPELAPFVGAAAVAAAVQAAANVGNVVAGPTVDTESSDIGDGSGDGGNGDNGDNGGDGGDGGTVALVRRGGCTFVEKARNVQRMLADSAKTNGELSPPPLPPESSPPVPLLLSAALVVVNSEDGLADMPKGQLAVDDVAITVAMLGAGDAVALERLIGWGIPVRATIAAPGRCPLPTAVQRSINVGGDGSSSSGDTPPPLRPRPADDAGGRLHVQWRDGARSFAFHSARYGPPLSAANANINGGGGGGSGGGSGTAGSGSAAVSALVAVEPADGCDEKVFTVRVSSAWVLVRRGGCSFGLKTLAAQRAGARGVVITNTEEATMPVQGSEEDARMATVPTVMVARSAGDFLRTVAGNAMVRLDREDFYYDGYG